MADIVAQRSAISHKNLLALMERSISTPLFLPKILTLPELMMSHPGIASTDDSMLWHYQI
jgi:hypothetical protein